MKSRLVAAGPALPRAKQRLAAARSFSRALTKAEGCDILSLVNSVTFPGCVMVAQQTLDLFVGVRILPGEILGDRFILDRLS